MPRTLFRWAQQPALLLVLSGLAACSQETPAPTGTITGQMAPVAAVGHLLKVVASGGGTEYSATADPVTGAFSLTVPPGTYRLLFTTEAPGGSPQSFPYTVPVTAVAGATVSPAVPPITHDRIGRGVLRWTLDGKPYTARAFIKVSGEGDYFSLWGRSEEFGPGSDVKEVALLLPQRTENGPLFVGAGTYALGGTGRVIAFGDSYVYPTNQPVIFWRYTTPSGLPPTGTVQLARYDAEQGRAAGTFAFSTTWTTGALVGTPAPMATVTDGTFDITF